MPPSNERIMVVDSDPDINDLISRQALQPLGYQVTVVTEASAALQQVIWTPPDLVIANLNLPGLSAKDMLVAFSAQYMARGQPREASSAAAVELQTGPGTGSLDRREGAARLSGRQFPRHLLPGKAPAAANHVAAGENPRDLGRVRLQAPGRRRFGDGARGHRRRLGAGFHLAGKT